MIIQLGNVDNEVIYATDAEHKWLNDYLSFDVKTARFSGAFQSGAWDGKARLYSLLTRKFPAGLLPLVQRGAQRSGKTVEFNGPAPARPAAVEADTSWLDPARDQPATLAACLAAGRGIVEAPTGSGKTEILVALTLVVPCRWLICVPSIDLLMQTAARFQLRTGSIPGRIGDGVWDVDGHRVIVSTFQTLYAGIKSKARRTLDLLPTFQAASFDECFPPGTMVAGKRIEDLRVGDLVPSWDPSTESLAARPILQVFKRVTTVPLVRVKFSGGSEITCTQGHPFLTRSGWARAGDLFGHSVLHIPHDMQYMRESIPTNPGSNIRAQEEPGTPGLLFPSLPPRLERETALGQSTPSEFFENAGEQSHEAHRNVEQDDRVPPQAGRLGPADSGWQRAASDRAPAESLDGFGRRVESRACDSHKAAPSVTPELQAGPCVTHIDAGDRGGWQYPPNETRENSGRQENQVPYWVRVDGVEVLQQGSVEGPTDLPAGDIVYNLHVDGPQTYIVNGAVVHNCHSLPAESFLAVPRRLVNATIRLGFSGTPLARGDQRTVYLIGQTGPIIHRVKVQTLIDAGVLSKPRIQFVPCIQRSVPGFTWAEVYKAGVVESKYRNDLLTNIAKQAAKPSLLFIRDISHGRTLLKLLRDVGLRVDFVHGANSSASRQTANKRLAHSDIDVLIASTIYDQGVDIPEVKSVIIGTAGKSDIKTFQRLGRGMRIAEGKNSMELWDVWDVGHKWLAAQADARQSAYVSQGYEVVNAPLGPTQ